MEKFISFCKTWGGLCLVSIASIALLVVYCVTQYTTDSALLRIIYGIPTLVPIGMGIPYIVKVIRKEGKG